MFKTLFYKYFDYDIVGEYYDNDGHGHLKKKYLKRYYLKAYRKWVNKRG